MKIAMVGIYGGVNRDFNPENVLIVYYTKRELIRRINNAVIDIYSLDCSMKQGMEYVTCFENKPYEMKICFFANSWGEELCSLLNQEYDSVILGGDIIIGLSDVFFLENLTLRKKHPPIFINGVSSLWRPQLISDYQKEKLNMLAKECVYIAVRENYVKEVFRSCNANNKIELVPDIVLLHQKDEWKPSEKVLQYVDECSGKGKFIGISDCFLRERDIVEALIKSKTIEDNSITFFSYSKRYSHSEGTLRYKSILKDYCSYITEYLDPWETYSLIERMNLCIGNAYHCTIGAVTSNVSFIGIDPSPFIDTRHTDMIFDKDSISNRLVKTEVVANDHSGVSLKKMIERILRDGNEVQFSLEKERNKINEHFDNMAKILLK